MNKKPISILLLSFLALVCYVQTANAATINSATLDKTSYLAGQLGEIFVTVYNDESSKIRVTELSATLDYYFTDGTVYVQKFFTSDTLPSEIEVGQSETYPIPISLPTNIAPGYSNPRVEARTDFWVSQTEHWISSDRPTYELKLYVESLYRQLYDSSQGELQSTQQLLQDQKTVNENLNNNVNMLAVLAVVFAVATGTMVFLFFTRRTNVPVQQP